MSVCELTSEPSALSAALWLIVKEDDVDKFPHAVQIAIKLFKTLPNLISPNAFCDMILDLKIKVYSCQEYKSAIVKTYGVSTVPLTLSGFNLMG